MASTAPPHSRARLAEVRHSAAQVRIITAALDLFAEYGVAGTSLQMIADRMGVTKAAVYHQFKTKEEIVIATADHELVALEAAVEQAEAARGGVEARLVLLRQLIDVSVRDRARVRAWQGDPAMMRVLAKHEPFSSLTRRMYALLVDKDDGDDWRIPAAMLAAVITAVGQPGLAGLDPDLLREEVFRYACRLLDLRD
ncbi:TetR/AcrR family transcriptional regulator [Frankia sp. CNm7]|uniref:TetR/AcrR family transcriptional regulator n=1 Tax=Frankia nepalensis TaxID=1836974 RepID=A0A937RDI1_9ACTN|nr:TetR/AcrR family transcriptional regulator [Frankia nepalensis]MBL7497179.1 TetR/AcrR family transcriptional regulator [Frankia nepalensis]MBL7513121.1 TetR/AcrR family transcriptional regulator [Frankia nepalensis]MBL7518336.1 TetR/AcrR family transcriptional regulator [Frankia nepalensis]MBL7626884.1 TetR/AcrR family transcriptional regulator [Frankia nepalensis]